MTYGLILVFEEVRSLLVGNDVHGVPMPAWLSGTVSLGGVMTYTVYRLFISAVGIGVALLLYWVITRSEEHTSELQSLMRISYAVFCLNKNKAYNTEAIQSSR